MELDEYRRMAAAGDKHWWYRESRALLRQLLEPRLDRRAGTVHLDAGGGTGATGGWLTEHGATLLADFEPLALEVARTDFPGLMTVQADLNAVPLADASVSTVLCVTVLCHQSIPDPGAVVRDLARVVRPGGIVCLWEPGVRRLRRGHDVVTHTARRFSRRDLRRLAEQAGLQVERSTGAYSFLVPAAATLAVLERGKATSDVGRNESGLGGVMSLLARLERRVLRRWNLPVGLSVIVVARKPA